jgi:hypothetical protein
VHPAILVSGSADRHLNLFSSLLHPVAAIAAPSRRLAYTADLPNTMEAPLVADQKQS